jgi:excisionase family DNA binding protein
VEQLLFSSSVGSVVSSPPEGEPAIPPNVWDLEVEELPPLLLTIEDAARVLKVSRNKVCVLIRQLELRSVKIGGLRRIPARALREYVDRLGSGDAA